MREKINVKNKTVKLEYDKKGNLEEIILEDKYDILDVLDNDINCDHSIKQRLIEYGLCVKDVKYWSCAEILLIVGTSSNELEEVLQIEEGGVWGTGMLDLGCTGSFLKTDKNLGCTDPFLEYTLLNVGKLKSKRKKH